MFIIIKQGVLGDRVETINEYHIIDTGANASMVVTTFDDVPKRLNIYRGSETVLIIWDNPDQVRGILRQVHAQMMLNLPTRTEKTLRDYRAAYEAADMVKQLSMEYVIDDEKPF